jgi:hypothetical protein
MPSDENRVFFESTIRFDAERIRAAAVYCSDGRFGDQCDELMHVALGLPRYDRLAVPGGAACLAGHFATYREEEGVAEQLRFLVREHQLERVVLIAHEHCAFYTERLNVSPLQLESQQRDDIRKAVWKVRTISRAVEIDAFLARKRWDGSIQFVTIEV